MDQKKRAPVAPILAYAAFAAVMTAIMMARTLDIDSYYMIPQGREILESGIPHVNTAYYYEGLSIVVQQWLYCVIEYLASLVPCELGLMALFAVQATGFLWLCRRYVREQAPDGFWSMAAALACATTFGTSAYLKTLRPETLTLSLLLLQMLATERYLKTKKARWLAALPVLVLLEANLHMSMWPFHFCILAAYLVPIPDKICPGGWKKPDWRLALAAAPMGAALLLQPYGLDGVTYLFDSMHVFGSIGISEQQAIALVDPHAFTLMLGAAACIWLTATRRLEAHEIWTSAGLLLASSMNYHATMLLALAFLPLARGLLRLLSSLDPQDATSFVPKEVKRLTAGLAVAACAACAVVCAVSVPGFREYHNMGPAVEYLKEHPDGNILNETDIGSILYYHGLGGRIQGDSRPELLTRRINGAVDGEIYPEWFSNGATDKLLEQLEASEGIGSVQEYLDRYGIQYILLPEDRRCYTYLWGWLENDSGWEKADYEGKELYAIWQRR